MYLDQGWLSDIVHKSSPNFNQRPLGVAPELVVIHNISLPAGQFGTGFIDALFCNTLDCAAHESFADLVGLEVSAHLLIDRSGKATQFVSFDDRAWHAGVSRYKARDNCNDFSVGIELEGTDDLAYTDAQYSTLRQVLAILRRHYDLAHDAVVGHSDIAPGRKTDPGAAFDWGRISDVLNRSV